MANENEKKKLNDEEDDEPKIPVFTVLKNGAILKNIFIVNKPPPPPTNKPISSVHQQTQEEILIVGRHPDCNIVLTHPSISRFHLQILSNPSSQQLSLTDLSSVHGTWVSEKRLEPGVRVELREGDILRVGGSSRVYSLHWIPLSRAYDFETPFVPLTNNDEDENAEGVVQDENSLSVENKEIESPDSNSVGIESLLSDENFGLSGKKEIPSAPPMPENAIYSIFDQIEEGGDGVNEFSSFWAFGTESVNLFLNMEESSSHPKENPESSSFIETERETCPTAQVPEETENQSPLRKDHGQIDISCPSGPLVMENLSFPIGEVLGENKDEQVEEESQEPILNLLVNLNFEHLQEKEEEAYPAAQVPEKIDSQSPLRKDDGPLVMENLYLPIGEVLGEDKDEQIEEESLEPISNLLDNLNFEHLEEKEEETYPAAQVSEKIDSQSPLRKNDGQTDVSCLSSPLVMENLSLPFGEVFAESKGQQVEEESLTLEPESNLLVNLNFEHSDEVECPVDDRIGETENKNVSPEEPEKRDATILYSEPRMKESINSCQLDGILSELIDDRESQTPQSLFTAVGQPESDLCESPPLRSENKSDMRGSIWARRGKRASVVQLQTDKSRGKKVEARYGDDIELEEEIFTPDKENLTPNTLRLRSLKKNGEIEFKHSKSSRSSSSKLSLISSIRQQDLIVSPEKENQKLKELRERKSVGTTSGKQARVEKKLTETKERRERMPFQSLLKNSGGKNISETSVPNTATRGSASSSCTRTTGKVANPLLNKSVGEGKRRAWTVVADTTTLLDKESRKSLQLLQGLKGTRLIIPRMVIRELDCLKQRGSLFRRKTEACLVLEWIEDCMVKTNWWIHVQSSMEDGRLIAPTPPVSPQSLSSDKSFGFPSGATSSLPFSRWSLMDLASPTAEDHILDCALLHRKMKNDGRLVLLSNDVTLKIKAMAEGLLCETAEEFRESLVNPISERFMWPDSSPRGRTWSYVPDAVLRERYSSCPLKKSSTGEGAKGLKLILLHNSHYGQIR